MRPSLILLLLPALTSAASTFRFAHSYGSHMVLHQAPKSPVVWGFCDSAAQCGSVNVNTRGRRGAGRGGCHRGSAAGPSYRDMDCQAAAYRRL